MAKCISCYYWDQSQHSSDKGLCRYSTPVVFKGHDSFGVTVYTSVWPKTYEDDWCGRYQSKETPMGRQLIGMNLEVFAHRLQVAREMKGLTQAALAKVIGMDRSNVCHYEKGRKRPKSTTLLRFANALNVSTDYLLGKGNVYD